MKHGDHGRFQWFRYGSWGCSQLSIYRGLCIIVFHEGRNEPKTDRKQEKKTKPVSDPVSSSRHTTKQLWKHGPEEILCSFVYFDTNILLIVTPNPGKGEGLQRESIGGTHFFREDP